MKLSNPLVLLAFVAEKSGFENTARSSYLFAAKTFNSADAWFRLGREAYKNADWKTAAENFKEAVRCDPNDAEIQFKLGYCQLKLQQWNEAKDSIGKAIQLAPAKTQWLTQYNQVLSKVDKSTLTGKSATLPRNIRDLSRILKTLTLTEDFAKFDLFYEVIGSVFAIKEPVADAQLALLMVERQLAEGKHKKAVEAAEAMDELSPYRSYAKAIIARAEGKHLECFDHLQEFLADYPDDKVAIRMLANAARLSGNTDVAWRQLQPMLKSGSQTQTWMEASLCVRNRTDADLMLAQWNDLKKEKSPATNHFRITRHVAAALAKAGNVNYAERILKEAAIALRNRKTAPPSDYYSLLGHPHYVNLPDTITLLDGVSLKSIETVTGRFSRAIVALVKLLDSSGIEFVAIGQTLAFVTRPGVTPTLSDAVEFGILNETQWNALHESINKCTAFFIQETFDAAGTVFTFSHVNGISLQAYLHKTSNGTTHCSRDGIQWKVPTFSLERQEFRKITVPVPADPEAYFREFSDDSPEPLSSLNCMISAKNRDIIDRQSFKFYLYHSLLKVSNIGDEAGVTKCIGALHALGEHDFVTGFYAKDGKCIDANLPQLLEDKPQVILYLSGLENVGYQGNMWIPVLEKMRVRSAIAIRERRIAPQLINTKLPVYFFDSMRDLELLEQAGVKTILYPANTQKNVQTLRFFGLNHFFINHGESDKVVNQSKFLMAYDKLLVAGPLAERRMRQAGLPLRNDQVVYVGRPQTELLLDKVMSPAKSLRTIFYAPTWEGFVEEANYASINEFGLQMLKALVARPEFQVIFKPHPFTGSCNPAVSGAYLRKMIEFSEKNGIKVIDAKVPIFDCMKGSDLLITDISSVLNDYLYTLKPMILTNPRSESHESLGVNYPSSAATYILDRGADIGSMLDSIIKDDHMFEQRKAVCSDSLGDLPQGSLATFERVVVQSLGTSN